MASEPEKVQNNNSQEFKGFYSLTTRVVFFFCLKHLSYSTSFCLVLNV